jgi:alcohol dehydrogenase class IV
MGNYGRIAVNAAKNIDKYGSPESAWEKASCEVFAHGCSSQKKCCPKKAFLGLYGGTGKNAEYAQAAVKYLKEHPGADIKPNELWEIVMNGVKKIHNSQMDVVISLYEEGLI